jgi:hypothetical protein
MNGEDEHMRNHKKTRIEEYNRLNLIHTQAQICKRTYRLECVHRNEEESEEL